MKIRGTKTVTANLTKAAAAIEGAVGDAVRKAAMEVERDAKINCPVDTGILRGSIGAEEKEPLLFEVGTNVEYAAHVEFGTSKMAAQPYLEPAAETARAKYLDIVKVGVRHEVHT